MRQSTTLRRIDNIGEGQITPKRRAYSQMLVYVISVDGKPLMPCTSAKARKLLNVALKAGGYDNITIIIIELKAGDN